MSKSSPAPVDYKGAAIAEGEASKDLVEQQTWANRPDQINPFGTSSWANTPVWDPTTGQNINKWTQTQTLSPAAQEALGYQMGLTTGRSKLGYGMLGNIGQDLGNPMDWSQFGTMQMPGEQQQMTDSGPGIWGSMAGNLPQYETSGTLRNLNFGDAPEVTGPQQGWQRAENSVYDRGMSRLKPQLDAERQQAEIKMRNQGLSPGDEAWKSTMQGLDQKSNDAYQNLSNEAIMMGGTEAQRMFGMESAYRDQNTGERERSANFFNQAGQQDFGQNMAAGTQSFQNMMAAGQFQNQAQRQAMEQQQNMLGFNQNSQYKQADYYNKLREQAMNEMITQRGYSLNEANALIAGQQVGMPQFGGFQGASQAQAPQYLNAANMQGQQNAANASSDNMWMNSMFGGLGSLAGVAGQYGMFSDRRLKRNIKRIGERKGLSWYEFDYVWGQHCIGVMADEAPAHAVSIHPSGFLMVDYSQV